MATLSTTTYLGQVGSSAGSVNSSAAYPYSRDVEGKIRYAVIPYVMTGAEATNDILQVCILKAPGDKVITAQSKVTGEALGSAVTVSFGDSSNATRYSGTLTLTAIHDLFWSSAPGTDTYLPTAITGTAPGSVPLSALTVFMKFVGVTTPTAGKKLLIQVAYESLTG